MSHAELLEFAVLQNRAEIEAAERALRARGVQTTAPGGLAGLILRAKRFARVPSAAANLSPDPIKSWDVLRTIETLTAVLGPDDAVLDMGSIGCAILPALHRLGFRDLSGIDLNDQVRHMPHADAVSYVVGDMTRTTWPDGRFAAITSISVIEHGVPDDALFAEVGRLLRPGGLFLFSTDYWPAKIDTSDTELFGLPWRIFSAEEIEALVETGSRHGLHPVRDYGDAIHRTGERPIDFAGKQYTFLFGAFELSR